MGPVAFNLGKYVLKSRFRKEDKMEMKPQWIVFVSRVAYYLSGKKIMKTLSLISPSSSIFLNEFWDGIIKAPNLVEKNALGPVTMVFKMNQSRQQSYNT